MSDIVIENLSVAYGDKTVFKGFSRRFESGKICVILGESGVGKSTLLNAVAGLVQCEGSIDKGNAEISYIFQKDRLIPTISVYKNLDLILRGVCKDKNERKKRIEEMLDLLEIADVKNSLPSKISGGQAQRVALARAYLYPADILLADEPFKALDTALKSRLIKQLVALNEKWKRTVLFVTHDISECLLLADEYIVLKGNPASVEVDGAIAYEQCERHLGDETLSKVREDLLKTMYA